MTVALLTTCWGHAFRPNLTPSILALGQQRGVDIVAPVGQTCCGLPAWDAGQREAARVAARNLLRIFAGYEAILTASPGCLRMVREHIPALLASPGGKGMPRGYAGDMSSEAVDALAMAGRCHDWLAYLVQQTGFDGRDFAFDGKIVYFRSCQQIDGSNEMPATITAILEQVQGARLLPAPPGPCCGFGNNLAWRYPALSVDVAAPLLTSLRFGNADVVVTDDAGCLLHLSGQLKRRTDPPLMHVAEALAAWGVSG